MNLSNRDLVLHGLFSVLPPQLERFVRRELPLLGSRQGQALGACNDDGRRGPGDLADLSTQIRVLTTRAEDGRYLFHLPPGLGSKLHEVRHFRNDVVHGRDLDQDQTLAALVAVSETLRLIKASAASREEARRLIHATGGPGAAPAPAAPLHVEVMRCPQVLSYAHAVAGLTLPVHLRLTGGARSGAVEVRLSVVEHDGALELTEPQTFTWSGTEAKPTATVELPLSRQNLLQVVRAGDAELCVELRGGDGRRQVLHDSRCLALAPRQWRLSDAAAWAGPALATFVQPDDGAVEEIAREALRACLGKHPAGAPERPGTVSRAGTTHSGAMGAQAFCPDELVEAACASVRRRRLTIQRPAAPWRTGTHRIAVPTEVLEDRRGTPLDVAVLLAAVLERLAVAATLALTEDNVLVAYDRGQARADGAVGTALTGQEPVGLATRVASGRAGLIDPQLAVSSPLAVLHRLSAAARRTALAAVEDVVLEVPLVLARQKGVTPQPCLERQEDDLLVEHPLCAPRPLLTAQDVGVAGGVVQAEDEDPYPSPAATLTPGGPVREEPVRKDPAREAPASVEEWKRHLLDLSVRNPLIHRDARKVIELMVPRSLLGSFEDLVNRRERVVLRAAPGGASQPGARAESLLRDEWAVEVDLPPREYRKHLGSLAAAARVSLEETGTGSLYLALGTLRWTSSGRQLHSPLVLVPVTLEQDDGVFYLLLDQAGASTPNYSLLARFMADTGIDLTELREPVRDKHGIDVDAVLTALATRLSQQRTEATVEATVHLGLFRFSTYRMWEDLNEHWTELGAHPLVSRLAGTGTRAPAAGEDLTGARHVGTDLDELTENLPLDADASQADVVAQAVAGRNLVVEGPPGTGKSQTVANLIFHALGQGRSVMFVAEKASALGVVARRLQEETGIGSLLLNLHDDSVRPSVVREALRHALETRVAADQDPGLAAVRARLSRSRARLNKYRQALHGRGTDGLSYYQAHQALVSASDNETATAQAALSEQARAVGLETFDAEAHTRLIDDYRKDRAQLRRILPAEVLRVAVRRRDAVLAGAGQRAEALRHEIGLRSSPKSVRELMSSYGDLITAITPCLLVSPDSAARFLPVLPAGRVYVDLVVFDEASQITVPGAVGAIGRGRSTVVVGDRRQMPPSPTAHRGDLEGEAGSGTVSVLERCREVGVTSRHLGWHYRSQVESLIAFSNKQYYNGDLLTFPSPLTLAARPDPGPGGFGVSWRRVVKGRYYPARAGTGRAQRSETFSNTNPVEAHEVVAEVLRRFEASTERIPSLGVVTLNVRQRDLIEERLRETGSARIVEALDARDGLLVRNLDNIQGEERDTILLSLTFSANERGVVPLNFGPLSHQGGERWLNVAITRARRQMIVFSSFDPEDLHAERTAYQGVKDLRCYLETARSGRAPRARPHSRSVVDVSRAEIAQELRMCGLEVSAGVGHSSFAIDLVLAPGGRSTTPSVAVLLDGPGWDRRATAADRDLLPVEVLKRMGWSRVERVWLPQWVADPRSVLDCLVGAVEGRPRAAVPAEESAVTAAPEPAPAAAPAVLVAPSAAGSEQAPPPKEPKASLPDTGGRGVYQSWQPAGVLSSSLLDQAEKDPAGRAQVVEVAQSICDVESPLTMHRLIVKLCRAFGVSRTVASREARVRSVLGQSFAYIDEHDFVWRTYDASLAPVGYRRNALDHVDSIEEIHPRELAVLMAAVRASSNGWDSPDDLYQTALGRLSSKKRRLGARGVKDALSQALREVEASDGE